MHDSLSTSGLFRAETREYDVVGQSSRLQWPTLRHMCISCCFRAEVSLLSVAIKPLFFAGKSSQMRKRLMMACFWSMVEYFEATKKFHFIATLNTYLTRRIQATRRSILHTNRVRYKNKKYEIVSYIIISFCWLKDGHACVERDQKG